MKLSDIAALSAAAIADAEIAQSVEILIDQSYAETQALLTGLPAEQNRMARYYLKTWYDKFQDGTTKLEGGKRAVDYDNTRDKLDLSMKFRRMLGLPMLSQETLDAIAALWRAQRGTGATGKASSAVSATAVW